MIQRFIYEYFVDPIIYKNGYNIVNTMAYVFLFVVLAYAIYKIIPRDEDLKRLSWELIPFVLLGSTLHVLEDAGTLNSFIFVTPMVWILTAAYALATYYISRCSGNDILWTAFGFVPFYVALSHINFSNFGALLTITTATIVSSIVAFLISINFKFMNTPNTVLMLVHMFDASTTFAALSNGGYFEEHVVGGIFTRLFGPAGMYFLKIPVLLFVFYILEKEDDERVKDFVRMLILILGLGPGTRNMLRLMAGV